MPEDLGLEEHVEIYGPIVVDASDESWTLT